MFIFKAMSFLWPFMKEMVLGEKTVKESLKNNKFKVLFLIVSIVSVGYSLYITPVLYEITQELLITTKKYEALKKVPPKTFIVTKPTLIADGTIPKCEIVKDIVKPNVSIMASNEPVVFKRYKRKRPPVFDVKHHMSKLKEKSETEDQ